MKLKIWLAILFSILALVVLSAFSSVKKSGVSNFIRVSSPLSGDIVSSPLVVKGEARGNWYFEADFPVRLLDGDGREIALGIATAEGDWMTTEFVPFSATLVFTNPSTPEGTLVLEKDNPSGLPEHANELRVPVKFVPSDTAMRSVELFFYNEFKDRDDTGNVMCSEAGLEAVERRIPVSMTPIQDTIKLLLKGELSSLERARGVGTEFPLAGLDLGSASLSDGVLTLLFNDPNNQTSGGSCRTNILRLQIEATAKQFEEVSEVKFVPEDIFQP